jgi:hypothetical protein
MRKGLFLLSVLDVQDHDYVNTYFSVSGLAGREQNIMEEMNYRTKLFITWPGSKERRRPESQNTLPGHAPNHMKTFH